RRGASKRRGYTPPMLRLLMAACALTTFVAIPVLAAPPGPGYERLGKFEKREVDVALKQRGLTLVADPSGRTVGRIIVVNRPVFTEDDGGFLQWFNVFHWTTQEHIVERDILLRPGMQWDRKLVDESARNVRNPILSNMVAILPVEPESGKANEVDLLVVTRDVWSLRLNTNFQLQEDQLTALSISLAENNFLGLRKNPSIAFSLNQGSFAVGPQYTDPNIAGTRLTLAAAASAHFAREDANFEGTSSSVTLSYPLWNLSRDWGGSLAFSHFDSNLRLFRGSDIFGYDVPETVETEALPWRYHYGSFEVQGTARYQWGTYLKQRLAFGYEFFRTDADTIDTFPSDVARAAFERDVLPRQETSSGPFVAWSAFTPIYRTYRNLKTFDLREDYRLGGSASFSIKQAMSALGSDDDYTAVSGSIGYAFAPVQDSYLSLGGNWSARVQSGSVIDQRVGASFWAATPHAFGAFRMIMRANYDARFDETANRFFTVGGDTGLRGHPVGFFTGERRFRANVELRSKSFAFYFFRFGGVLFYDTGHAADTVEELRPVHDVGAGLRVLIPQINPFVLRADWAFATEGPGAGFPGRFSAGFLQAF
ncbi:MAG: hypothetical protein ACI9WU_002071, partial [Myxococcota bacterium]